MKDSWRILPSLPYLYFITSTIMEWIPLFLSAPYCDIVLEALTFRREQDDLRLHAYVIMPNHIHLIASTPEPTHLSDVMRDLKRYTSRRITEKLGREGARYELALLRQERWKGKGNSLYKVWQDGFHPIAIWSQSVLCQKLEYVHNNPVRKGLVRRPEDWVYSSATDYLTTDRGLIEIDKLVL